MSRVLPMELFVSIFANYQVVHVEDVNPDLVAAFRSTIFINCKESIVLDIDFYQINLAKVILPSPLFGNSDQQIMLLVVGDAVKISKVVVELFSRCDVLHRLVQAH